jgi:heat-inducible transcriptional repressor
MADLSARQKLILALIIRNIELGEGIGSEKLVEDYHLKFSSATIRNEMIAMTEMGYLRQPHTSAGRVPTEEGYRYFVRQLMGHADLPDTTKRTISHQFYQVGSDVNRWMRLAAAVLAQQSQGASVVTAPHTEQPMFKHLELIGTYGRQVLMVLVITSGEVSQEMLTLAEPVSQERLSATAQVLNHLLVGLRLGEISSLGTQLDPLEQDIVHLVTEEMHRMVQGFSGDVYRDGLTHALAEPEQGDAQAMRSALRILEQRSFLEDLLARTAQNTEPGGVQVLIGGEGSWQELRDYSMVLSRYGAPGLATGMLGVLGSIQMPYGRTISTVRFVAGLLSDLVEDLHTEG